MGVESAGNLSFEELARKVLSIKNGSPSASGTAISSSDNFDGELTFIDESKYQGTYRYIEVRNLDFKPKTVIAIEVHGSPRITVFTSIPTLIYDGPLILNVSLAKSQVSSGILTFKGDNYPFTFENGFKIPIYLRRFDVNWIAFG